MVTFNIRQGVMRCRAPAGQGYWYGNEHLGLPPKTGYAMVHISKRPMRLIEIGNIKVGDTKSYVADEWGNIEVDDPIHINSMAHLGYPIFSGVLGRAISRLDDLVWPNMLIDDSPYERLCMGHLKAKAVGHQGGTNG